MKIQRQGKQFIVLQKDTIVSQYNTFDEARLFLASNGNQDAALPLVSHSNKVRNESLIEPEFSGEYEIHLNY